jgi:hypothetical protein
LAASEFVAAADPAGFFPVDHEHAWGLAEDAEAAAQCGLARCLFGNPFRLVAFPPSWRTPQTEGLARSAYDRRDWALLPVLADALEEAGCGDTAILAHCREGRARPRLLGGGRAAATRMMPWDTCR